MTRTTAREIAVQLSFAMLSNSELTPEEFFSREYYDTLAEECILFEEYPNERQLRYIRELAVGVVEHREELDARIEQLSHAWRLSRISRTAAAVLRCAIYEILYMPDVPNAAAINEAVELAKGYEDPETVSFINGILGAVVRSLNAETPDDPEITESALESVNSDAGESIEDTETRS